MKPATYFQSAMSETALPSTSNEVQIRDETQDRQAEILTIGNGQSIQHFNLHSPGHTSKLDYFDPHAFFAQGKVNQKQFLNTHDSIEEKARMRRCNQLNVISFRFNIARFQFEYSSTGQS